MVLYSNNKHLLPAVPWPQMHRPAKAVQTGEAGRLPAVSAASACCAGAQSASACASRPRPWAPGARQRGGQAAMQASVAGGTLVVMMQQVTAAGRASISCRQQSVCAPTPPPEPLINLLASQPAGRPAQPSRPARKRPFKVGSQACAARITRPAPHHSPAARRQNPCGPPPWRRCGSWR